MDTERTMVFVQVHVLAEEGREISSFVPSVKAFYSLSLNVSHTLAPF